jgi:hypothetical protein
MTCVYTLIDPRTDDIFYVGIGDKHRPRAHFSNFSLRHKSYKNNKIRKLRREGVADVDMVRVLVRDVTPEQAKYLERFLVEALGRHVTGTGTLTNIKAGGDATPLDSPLARKRHAEWHAKPETKAQLSARALKRNANPAMHKKAAATRQKYFDDPEWRAAHVARTRAGKAARTPEQITAGLANLTAAMSKPERRAANAARAKARWAGDDPEYRAKVIAAQKAGKSTPEFHAKRAAASSKAMTPERRAAHGAMMKAKWADPAWRSKTIATQNHGKRKASAILTVIDEA